MTNSCKDEVIGGKQGASKRPEYVSRRWGRIYCSLFTSLCRHCVWLVQSVNFAWISSSTFICFNCVFSQEGATAGSFPNSEWHVEVCVLLPLRPRFRRVRREGVDFRGLLMWAVLKMMKLKGLTNFGKRAWRGDLGSFVTACLIWEFKKENKMWKWEKYYSGLNVSVLCQRGSALPTQTFTS